MSKFFHETEFQHWSFKNFIRSIINSGVPSLRQRKKLSDEYNSALNALLTEPDLTSPKLNKATSLYNQFKKRKELMDAKTETFRAQKRLHMAQREALFQQHSVVVAGVGVSKVEGLIVGKERVLGSVKTDLDISGQEPPRTPEHRNPSDLPLYEEFVGGSKTPTPKRNKDIRKAMMKFEMILGNNVNVRTVLKTHKNILDLTSPDHQRMFSSANWDRLKVKPPSPNIPVEVLQFMKSIQAVNDARSCLDKLVIPDSEIWRYVRKIYELFVDDFRLTQQLEDSSTTERTYTSKFLLPIIDAAISCVHRRLRLQWCESKAASNILHLVATSALRDGRDGTNIDSVGTLNKKYDLIALEVAGPPHQEILAKTNSDKNKINLICKDMINAIAHVHTHVTEGDLKQCGVVRLRAYGLTLEAAFMTMEAPEVWIVRPIATTTIPTNRTELHLVKKVIAWGLVLRQTLEEVIKTLRMMEEREDEATIPWYKFVVENDK